MFGGPPPQPSKAEIQAAEDEATQTVRIATLTCVVLYISPFAIDYVRRLV